MEIVIVNEFTYHTIACYVNKIFGLLVHDFCVQLAKFRVTHSFLVGGFTYQSFVILQVSAPVFALRSGFFIHNVRKIK